MKKILLLFVFAIATNQIRAQDERDAQIYSLVRNMEVAWDNKDASQFARNFCKEHDFIVWNGMYSPNITIEANKNGHEFLFSELEKKSDIKYVVDKIRYLSDQIALVHILGSTYQKDQTPPSYPTQILTWIVVNEDNSWKIKSFHSTDIEYDVFIMHEACPEESSSREQKENYAKEYYKSYYSSLTP